MNFELFSRINNYTVANKRQFEETFQAFLERQYIVYFMQAIQRSASEEEQNNIKKRINIVKETIFEKFNKRLPEKNRKAHRMWGNIWDELTHQPSPNRYDRSNAISDRLFSDVFFSLLVDNEQELYLLECEIIALGIDCLDKEHQKAMQSLLDERESCYSFDEYVDLAWSGIHDGSELYKKKSFFQLLGYLYYLKSISQCFYQEHVYSTNREKAQAVLTLIELSEGKFLKKMEESADFLNQTPPATGIGTEHIETFFKLSEDLVETEQQLKTALQSLYEYWTENLPRAAQRSKSIETIKNHVLSNTKGKMDIVWRNTSPDEANDIGNKKAFQQFYGKSFERAKWFYLPHAQLGNGVEHAIRCKIFLFPGTIDLLKSLQQPDGHFSAVVSKDLEPDCIGIYEDALPAFNLCIQRIEFYKKTEKSPCKTLYFTDQDRENHKKAIIHFNLLPIMSPYQFLDKIHTYNALNQNNIQLS